MRHRARRNRATWSRRRVGSPAGAHRANSATMASLANALRTGSLVSMIPEGTTWCGLASGRFTTATFQAAIDGGVPVRPIALRYRLADGRETSRPAFIGPESLIASLRRVAALRGLVLEIHICPGDRRGPRGEPS
ncbi:1-acyl-sn-glycerol-3-phosphate acyltransferase [Streptomyces humidus]|nr:1-acyl-sn-glycerol-3-phosphate acyltransferase [Streptomyces humidus]